MKKLVVAENCIACGSCSLATNLLTESPNGKAVPVEPAIVPENSLGAIQEIINNCPVKAISLVTAGMVKASGNEGLSELKSMVLEKLGNYLVTLPPSTEYRFNKSDFSIPIPFARGARNYEYSSYDKARTAGRKEFDMIMYSQSRAIIQQILVAYKNKKLRKYAYYDRQAGNFYHDINCDIERLLKELVAEARFLSQNRINLPEGFDNFEFDPSLEILNQKKVDSAYKLKHLEEIYVVSAILDTRESLSWYETYIDIDDREDYNGKTKYCYENLTEACQTFAGYLLDDMEYVVNDDFIAETIEFIVEEVRKEIRTLLSKKVEVLVRAIDSCKV